MKHRHSKSARATIRRYARTRRIQYGGIEYVTTIARYRECYRLYGPPNAIDLGLGPFSGRSASLFVDDEADGKPVAYAPAWLGILNHRRRIADRSTASSTTSAAALPRGPMEPTRMQQAAT